MTTGTDINNENDVKLRDQHIYLINQDLEWTVGFLEELLCNHCWHTKEQTNKIYSGVDWSYHGAIKEQNTSRKN
jgi:hypothetical protein